MITHKMDIPKASYRNKIEEYNVINAINVINVINVINANMQLT